MSSSPLGQQAQPSTNQERDALVENDLWSYDPINQVIRSAKCESHCATQLFFRFLSSLEETLSYEGNTQPSPVGPSTSFISMHELELVDNSLFDEPSLCEIGCKTGR